MQGSSLVIYKNHAKHKEAILSFLQGGAMSDEETAAIAAAYDAPTMGKADAALANSRRKMSSAERNALCLEIAGIALLKVQKLAREQENEEMTNIVRWWIKESQKIEG